MSSPSPKPTARGAGWVVGAALACVGIGAIAAAAAAVHLARKTVIPMPANDAPVRVEWVGETGSLRAVRLSGDGIGQPGKYSFLFDEGRGHARLGDILDRAAGTVTRELVSVERGELHVGATGQIKGWWYTTPDELGIPFERITVPTELGDAEAWMFTTRRSRKRRWAVHVHGRGGLPQETLRGVAAMSRLGITSLVISYRNDPAAPAGHRGRYGLGISESRDVDAAIAEAVRRGAERVTLVGYSMGGTASLIAAAKGTQRDLIDGLVLDSPAIDWDSLLRYQAGLYRVPTPITRMGISLLHTGAIAGGEPDGIDFAQLTPAYFAKSLRVPTLIHASRADAFVPSEGSELLARARPDLVELRLTEEGDHVRLWNVDPESWEQATVRFMRWLPRPAWRG